MAIVRIIVLSLHISALVLQMHSSSLLFSMFYYKYPRCACHLKKKKTSSNASLLDVFRRGEKLCSALLLIGKYIIIALTQNRVYLVL
jgi:hypothetical protein